MEFWTTKNGDEILIKDMTDNHIQNTIEYFLTEKLFWMAFDEDGPFIDDMSLIERINFIDNYYPGFKEVYQEAVRRLICTNHQF